VANILFVTCDRWPQISQSDALVATALAALGHRVEPAPWQGDFARFQAADLVVLRSHWDYHYDMIGFMTWLDRLAVAALPVYNPVDLVRWNLHKSYLLDLQAQGFLIPVSCVLRVGESPVTIYQQQGWSNAVIKPLAGASGHLVERVAYPDLTDWATRVRSQTPDRAWLIQEFIPEIQEQGELSLVFIDGEFSHAIAKRPQPGEFRINSQYQSQVNRVEPEQQVIDQAHTLVNSLPVRPLYARVDGVVTATGVFCLIELELNEPALGYQYAPELASRFAAAIHATAR